MKIKNLLILVLSIIMMLSFGMFAACQNSNEKLEIQIVSPNVKYAVGENIDATDFFVEEKDVVYTFDLATVSSEGIVGEAKKLGHKTFYAESAGIYRLTIYAQSGKAKGEKSVDINVYDTIPFLIANSKSQKESWGSYKNIRAIMLEATPFVLSDTEYEQYIESVTIKPISGEEISFPLMVSGSDFGQSVENYYVGNDGSLLTKGVFTFATEGVYSFVLTVKNGGGSVSKTITIECEEDLSDVAELSTKINFNEQTLVASWDSVENATKYRIKILGNNIEQTETTINLSQYITKDYMDYTLVVIPCDNEGNYLGKMTYKARIIVGGNASSDGKTITLTGVYPKGQGVDHVNAVDSSYFAFRGQYDIGTFVELKFTEDNMPNVMFFADEINGNMTYLGGDGILVTNGLDTGADDKNEESYMRVFGPNRLNQHTSWGNALTTIGYTNGASTNLLTQKGLKEAALNSSTANRTYKYIVGTKLNEKDEIVLVQYLYDNSTGELLTAVERTLLYKWDFEISNKVPQEERVLTKDDVSAGSIVIYPAMNGEGKSTTFTFSEPTVGLPEQAECNATYNNDGSVTLKANSVPTGTNPRNELNQSNNSYISFKGDYGVGSYIQLIYKGNNMPYVLLLADNINGNFTFNGGNGLLLVNGMVTSNSESHNSKFRVYGPNRMNCLTSWEPTGSVEPLLTQQGLIDAGANKEYRSVIGTTANEKGELILIVRIYDESKFVDVNDATGLLLRYETTVKQSYDFSYVKDGDENYAGQKYNPARTLTADMFSGTNIILYAAMKGENQDTTFKYEEPQVGSLALSSQGATFNSDDSVTLKHASAYTTTDVRSFATKSDNSYISFTGNYGIGTYMEFIYTGNNMPSVMFFADEINGNITYGGGNSGLLILNGFVYNQTTKTAKTYLYGPNRMNTPYDYVQTGLEGNSYNLFTQDGVDPNTEYRYVIGTKLGENNQVIVVGRIYENSKFTSVSSSDGLLQRFETVVEQSYDFSYIAEGEQYSSTQKWNKRVLTADMFTGTNIVVYGLTKQDGSDTTFKYEQPKTGSLDITVITSGAIKNADGSITLKAVSLPTSTDPQAKYAYNRNDNSYIGFQGDYGVGTYIDIIFKGNNMPNIMLLADDINGNMSCFGGDSGLFIATGYVFSDNKKDLSTTRVYGPNRMNSYASWEDNNVVAGVLTQQGLINAAANSETADREYKLTVGTKKGNQTANGYEVVLVMKIYDNTTGALLNSYEKTITQKYDFSYTKEGDANYTGQKHNPARTLTTDLFSGTNIILYQAFKGAGEDTTFKYSMPYTVEE